MSGSAAPDRLCILDVLASPFPSRQGTQVAVHNLCEGLARRGHDVHLLVYAYGAFPLRASYAVHRIIDLPRFRSLRSGPAWRRVPLDLLVAFEMRRLARALRPDLIHLHSVEAAAAALIVPPRPRVSCVYHAHNLMAEELPTYFDAAWRVPARAFGARLDAALARRADLTIAVSEPTRAGLIAAGAPPDRVVTVEPGVDLVDLAHASATAPHPAGARPPNPELRTPNSEPRTVAYLGNLDPYQGLDRIVDALACLRDHGVPAVLVVVSESDPAALRSVASRSGVPVSFVEHGPLEGALAVAASCEVAVVARSVRGGFPIKLAVLLGAGIPVVATPSAVAGLGLDDVVRIAADESPRALARAIERALTDPDRDGRIEAAQPLVRERWTAYAAAARIEREIGRVAAERRQRKQPLPGCREQPLPG